MTGGVISKRGLRTYDTTQHRTHIDRDGMLFRFMKCLSTDRGIVDTEAGRNSLFLLPSHYLFYCDTIIMTSLLVRLPL